MGKVKQINGLYCLHLIIKSNTDLTKINNYFKVNSLENFDIACKVLKDFIIKNNVKCKNPIMFRKKLCTLIYFSKFNQFIGV